MSEMQEKSFGIFGHIEIHTHLEDFFNYRWLLISNVLQCFERFLYDITICFK